MTSRRNFILSGLLGGAIPFLPYPGYGTTNSTENFKFPSPEDSDYWEQIRSMFPIPKDEAYFNTGTLGVMPFPVMNAVIDNIRFNGENAARTDYKGEGPLLLSGYEAFVETRKKIGKLINADYKEITLTQNATLGMNFVAHGLELNQGDEVIQTNQEHGGGSAAWKLLAKRKGLEYIEVEMPVPANDPQEIINRISNVITQKTRIIAIPAIVSVYGVVMPVKEICSLARERGILTVLDGAQCVGQIPVDVKEIGCDVYFSSLHKWLLSPAGSGILYIDQELQPKVWTTLASYNWENEEDHGFRLQQYGTGLPAIIDGMNAALDFHNKVGPERWTSRVKELGDYLRNGIKDIPKMEIHSSTHQDMSAGLTTYHVPGVSGPDVQKKLWDTAKLQPRSVGKELVRHSTHIYNNKTQIDAALTILEDLTKKG